MFPVYRESNEVQLPPVDGCFDPAPKQSGSKGSTDVFVLAKDMIIPTDTCKER